MAKIVIVGAGLTGLSAAYHLEKRGFYDYKLFEKESTVGGLCRSVEHEGFTFDYTGHLLHTKSDYFKQFIADVVGMDNLHAIYRRSFIYSQERYTRYPYQINLFGLPHETIIACIKGFVERKPSKKHPQSFHDWVLSNLGAGFAQHFFFPFQSKLLAYDLKKVCGSWTGRFVPPTSLEKMLSGALADKFETDIGYNAQFFYPKQGGINFWINKVAQRLRNPIATDCAIQSIDTKQKVVCLQDGTYEPYEHLISTMPLPILLRSLKERSNSFLAQTADKLVCNSVVNFNLGFNRPDVSDKHWIYVPEKEYPFYRLGFPHNFAPSMAPAGCSSLYGEFSYIDRAGRYPHKRLVQALTATKKILQVTDADIIAQKVIHIPYAYVIYDFWREKNIAKVHQRLEEQQLYSVGRYGEWKYSSMEEAVLDGKKIADLLVMVPAQRCSDDELWIQPVPQGRAHEVA